MTSSEVTSLTDAELLLDVTSSHYEAWERKIATQAAIGSNNDIFVEKDLNGSCLVCIGSTEYRCANCKLAFYCSRKCQREVLLNFVLMNIIIYRSIKVNCLL